jgi:hypothetical protein
MNVKLNVLILMDALIINGQNGRIRDVLLILEMFNNQMQL